MGLMLSVSLTWLPFFWEGGDNACFLRVRQVFGLETERREFGQQLNKPCRGAGGILTDGGLVPFSGEFIQVNALFQSMPSLRALSLILGAYGLSLFFALVCFRFVCGLCPCFSRGYFD